MKVDKILLIGLLVWSIAEAGFASPLESASTIELSFGSAEVIAIVKCTKDEKSGDVEAEVHQYLRVKSGGRFLNPSKLDGLAKEKQANLKETVIGGVTPLYRSRGQNAGERYYLFISKKMILDIDLNSGKLEVIEFSDNKILKYSGKSYSISDLKELELHAR